MFNQFILIYKQEQFELAEEEKLDNIGQEIIQKFLKNDVCLNKIFKLKFNF